MENRNERKNKHMTMEDRMEIQQCLNHGMTFKAIARRIGKDQTTVSKEVKKHITTELRRDSSTQQAPCQVLLKAPFVCNACQKRTICHKTRHLYVAKNAHKDYLALLSDSREGIPLSKEHFYENDRIILKGIKQGQHLYHILQTNDLGVSKSTVYRHLRKGYLSVAAIDFPRAVKYKPRKQRPMEHIPSVIKRGRTYDDFLAFRAENGVNEWVEMDTVVGEIGGKCILTFDFTHGNFMLGFLLDNKTSAEVARVVTNLKDRLLTHGLSFGFLFPVILTDNGGEFSNVTALENSPEGVKEASLFFCDPYQSSQKPHVEKNHSLFRDILPQGRSFDFLTQEMVNQIFSHVNSVKRRSLNGKTPYDVFSFLFGEIAAEALGICPIDAKDVIQSPKLLETLHC